jgi:hypothetical protein
MDKITERIDYYKKSLERMKRLANKYHNKRDKCINEEIAILVLEAELQQVTEFIEDLEYLKEC